MDPASFKKKFDDVIWGDGEGVAQKFRPIRLARLVLAVSRDIQEGDLSLRATSLVYTTLLSLAPLLAIAFSVLKGFGAHDQIEPFLRRLLEPLGDQSGEITQRIVGFVDNIQVGVLGALGLAMLLYGSISLLQKVEESFNDIWRVPNARSFSARLRDYVSVLLIGPLFMFLSTGMSAALHNAEFMKRWLGVDLLGGAIEWVFAVIPYVLFMLAFTALYMFMPNTRVRAVPALVAGFTTAVLWKVLGLLFGVFIVGSASYAAIYSVFAALILCIIWLYAGWMIVLMGACLCYYLQNPSNQPISRRFRRLSTRLREKLALQICAEVGGAFYRQQPGLGIADLSARLMMPALVIENVAGDLIEGGILAAAGGRTPHLVPDRPFELTTVEDMLRVLRATDESGMINAARLKATPAVEAALATADAAMQSTLGRITLKQLSLEDAAA